jgi:hypothetical protein
MQKLFYDVGEAEPLSLTRRIVSLVSALVLLGMVGYLDRAAPREVSFGVFYFLPIWIVTWNFGLRAGLLGALVCALVWFRMDRIGGPVFSGPFVPYWRAAVMLVYFSTFAFMLASVREQLLKSAAKVKRLSGLLPICANCRKIRNDEGYWQQLEEYIPEHSDANLSHGLCPDCARDLYPDLADAWIKSSGKSQQ